MIRKDGQISEQCQSTLNDYLLGINFDPIPSTTKFRSVSCTMHITIGGIRWSAWAVNCVVAI